MTRIVHNMLMIGSPGTGKTLLAKRRPTIVPPLTPAEHLETARIYSALGRLRPDEAVLATRPLRSPHTIRDAGMVSRVEGCPAATACRGPTLHRIADSQNCRNRQNPPVTGPTVEAARLARVGLRANVQPPMRRP
jgi:hypothetical protein